MEAFVLINANFVYLKTVFRPDKNVGFSHVQTRKRLGFGF